MLATLLSSALTSSPLLIKDLVLTPVLLTISLWKIYIRVYSFCLQLYQRLRGLGSPETGVKLEPVDRQKGSFPACRKPFRQSAS